MSVQELRWRKTDSSIRLINCPGHEDLWLVYGRIYTSRAGYSYSETNQLIFNLKILPNAEAVRRRYKEQAIQRFAEELCGFWSRYPEFSISLVPMPPSKTVKHPDYDDRIEQVAWTVASDLHNVFCLPLLLRIRDVPSSHQHPGISRSSERIYQDLLIDEAVASSYQGGTVLMLLDDVLTSGAHFSAARRCLLERFPGTDVRGMFWAKAQELFEQGPR